MKKLLVMMLTFVMLAGCAGEVSNMDSFDPEGIRVALYPSSGGRSETYYFALNTEGDFLVEYGTRTGNDLTQSPFMEKNSQYDLRSKQKHVSSDVVNKIYSLADEIYKTEHPLKYVVVHDSWEFRMLYQNEVVIEQNYYDASPEIIALVEELKSISPIKVNLRGFA